MQSIKSRTIALLALALSCWAAAGAPAVALESDRQQALEVNADSTNGILGDGVTVLSGHVEIRQGTLLIRADRAEVDKSAGKVRQITLQGEAAFLQQQIEELGLVRAWANKIEYQVGSGLVLLSGNARVEHPQYAVSGDQLRYDLNVQHFEGVGSADGNGRVHIRLDPEVAPGADEEPGGQEDPDSEDPEVDDDPPPDATP
jgi:lipopolysaccharide export system protein LptA